MLCEYYLERISAGREGEQKRGRVADKTFGRDPTKMDYY